MNTLNTFQFFNSLLLHTALPTRKYVPLNEISPVRVARDPPRLSGRPPPRTPGPVYPAGRKRPVRAAPCGRSENCAFLPEPYAPRAPPPPAPDSRSADRATPFFPCITLNFRDTRVSSVFHSIQHNKHVCYTDLKMQRTVSRNDLRNGAFL